MSDYYKLVGTNAVPVADVLEWARTFEDRNRYVALDRVGDVKISTVFLGFNHAFGESIPILFETMVFGGALDETQQRYAMWELAEVGHREIVERVKKSLEVTA